MLATYANEALEDFQFRSLHLPTYQNNADYKDCLTISQAIMAKHGISTALTHPLYVSQQDYAYDFFEQMVAGGIPLAIENMDKQTNGGFKLVELETLINKYNLNFVLDVQHAYEHDPSMSYALDLFKAFGHKITHCHVSGETKDNPHALLYQAKNTKAIINFLATILDEKNVPLILEGKYTNSKELKTEISFIKKELS